MTTARSRDLDSSMQVQSSELHADSHAVREGVVLVDPPLEGRRNMEIDESLLAAATPAMPIVLRVYRWEQATVSLGHFQDAADMAAFPSLAALPVVRRKTGGGAIVHDREWTYSVTVPDVGDRAFKGHSETLYRAIHSAFVDRLRQMGWDARLSEECTCETKTGKKEESFLCFLRRAPVDLVVGQHKIMGSAQRRTANGLLQHGSLLICRSPTTPALFGLLDTRIPSLDVCPQGSERLIKNEMRTKHENAANCSEPSWISDAEAKNELNSHLEWIVTTLKEGIGRVIPCRWRDGKLSDLLEAKA